MANLTGYLKDKNGDKIYPDSSFPNGDIIYSGVGKTTVTGNFGDYKYLLIYISWYSNTPTTTFIQFSDGKLFNATSTVYASQTTFWFCTGVLKMTNNSITVTNGYQMNLLDGQGGWYDCCQIEAVIGFK